MEEENESQNQDMRDDERLDNPNLNQDEDYEEEDLKHVLNEGDLTSWDDIISWLRNDGLHDNVLSPGKVKNMLDDLIRLKDTEAEYTNDPTEIINLAKATRE